MSCDALLDPAAEAAEEHARPPRPFHVKSLGITAGIAVLLVILFQVVGLTFSMEVLPVSESAMETAVRVEALAEAGTITQQDAEYITGEMIRTEALRDALDHHELSSAEAERVGRSLRPADQSVVLGIGGVSSLFPPLLAFLVAALATVSVVRVRRLLEIGLGAGVGALAQLVAWLVTADFQVGAVFSGELWMTSAALGFNGAPIMLLGMALVIYVAWTAGAGWLVGVGLEAVTGFVACDHCEHRFAIRPRAPTECPKCHAPYRRRGGPRYTGSDLILAELGPSATGVTRQSTGATELLCLRCAKTYAADRCPAHPFESLLDPSRDEVKFHLLELDNEAGTSRFARWTGGGLGIDAEAQALGLEGWAARADALDLASSTTAPVGPRLCMECARTYDAQPCPTHPDEPLLDPTLEAVRLELVAADDRARSRTSVRLMVASVVTGLCAGFGLLFAIGGDGFQLAVLVAAGVTFGLITVSQLLVPRLAPPRFSKWTGEGRIDLDEFGMGAQATIFAPLHRALRRMRKEATRMAIATAVGAGIGAGVGAVLGWMAPLAVAGGFLAFVGYAIVASAVDEAKDAVDAVKQVKAAWDDPYA